MLLRSLFLILFLSVNCSAEYLTVTPDYKFEFPRDHGSHNDFPMEWWYFTGHLKTKNLESYGFEITVFRVGVDDFKASKSPWKSKNIFLVHTALTDDKNKKYYHQEEFIRENFDLVKSESNTLSISVLNHQIKLIDQQLNLFISLPEYQLELSLETTKPVILHGASGYSAKGQENGNASLYMSFTNLQGNGKIKIKDQPQEVTAKVWMDHEVMGETINRKIASWDWFAIQLDNNTELMLYYLKDENGNVTNFSKGTFINEIGQSQNLNLEDFTISVLDTWESTSTSITYPALWKIVVPKLNLDLVIKPSIPNQEFTSNDLSLTYWEGRSFVYQNEQKIGEAYVELVGYQRHTK